MKYLKYFLIASAVIFTSYTIKPSRLSEPVQAGELMPEFNLKDDVGTELDLKHLRGQKVLVSFWASYDANSHKDNVLLYNTVLENNCSVKMISVCFDKNKSVFDKTIEMDGIDKKTQFHEMQGANSQLYQMYGCENGFKNYLINEEGVVIATNVTPDDLKILTKKELA